VIEHGFTEEAVNQIKALDYFFYLNTNGHYKWFNRRFARLFVTHLMRIVSGKERVPEFMKLPPHEHLEHFYNLSNHPEINMVNLRRWLNDLYGPEGQHSLLDSGGNHERIVELLELEPRNETPLLSEHGGSFSNGA
jgi:hypothetical protein